MPAALSAAEVRSKQILIDEFSGSGMSKAEFARRLGKSETSVHRLLDPARRTKIRLIEKALRVMGKRLVFEVEAK